MRKDRNDSIQINGGINSPGIPVSHVGDPWIKRDESDSPSRSSLLRQYNEEFAMETFCSNCQSLMDPEGLGVITKRDQLNSNTDKKNSKLAPQKKKSIIQIIVKNFISFCENTSLRGVPKIVKTRDPCRKILWAAFVLILFMCCVGCLILIIKQYTNYDVIHQPVSLENQTRSFPSFSICNLRPFSSDGYAIIKEKQLLSHAEFVGELKKSITNSKVKLNKSNKETLATYFKLNTYFLNLPESISAYDLGHSLGSLIYSCNVQYRMGGLTKMKHCRQTGNWTRVLEETFLNCYMYTLYPEFIQMALTLEMEIFLDNPTGDECADCGPISFLQMSGARIELHEDRTYPEIRNNGINIMSGTITEIRFKPREWNRLEKPYGNCSHKVDKTISFNDIIYKYSSEACSVQELQLEMSNNCDCIDSSNIPNKVMRYKKEKKFCQMLPFSTERNVTKSDFAKNDVNKFLNKSTCYTKTKAERFFKVSKCLKPCTYLTYDTTTSTAKWPIHAHKKKFLNLMRFKKMKEQYFVNGIQNQNRSEEEEMNYKSAERRIKFFNEMLKLHSLYSSNSTENISKISDFIDNNFMAIIISRPNFDITQVNEKAVISLPSLLSQIGGLLSIFIGLTFICVVEIIELILNIFQDINNSYT